MEGFDKERLIREYTPKKKTGVDEAMRLDKKAKLPPTILAYILGIVGTLILGVGMCLAMQVIGDGSTVMLAIGVVVGIIGIAMVSVNYPVYVRFMRHRKKKYSSAILLALNEDK